MTPEEISEHYRVRFEKTLRDWMLYHQHDVVFSEPRYFGIPILKSPLDLWIYQEIVYEVRPEVIVEIGAHLGGSALYLVHLLDLLGSGKVVSVDINHGPFFPDHRWIKKVTGHSSDPGVVATVSEYCLGKRTLVIHDADHHAEQVLLDLEAYAPLITSGSYFIVEDGIVDLIPELAGYPGPLVATEKFLETHSEFEVDESRERYLLTYNSRGFLRRK